jgi:hypothetical protein
MTKEIAMKLLAAIVVISALLVSMADAATLVVAGGHPQAADTNAGTADKPFRTISAAVAKAQAGDTVVVMPGRYPEEVKIDNERHPLRGWLTIAAGGGEAVVLDGADAFGPERWKPLPGSAKIYCTELPADPPVVFLPGHRPGNRKGA